ncbi:hypothetical protein G7Z17_g1173 [Cylindrodendrum hubeiense]|uniref:Rhodopsin domain-containing protein n=1 Tax=Cylindrodendrum hubeiense TaxID=595255 RepID=A0A9P5HK66_9HYPO|nr:hypothetical protein G7Z17_g1173 [Cylindrodendrum hubeiense]
MAPVYVMDPPEGEVRTTFNPPSSAGGVMPAGVATTVLACIALCLRLFTRKYVVKGVLGLDDLLDLGAGNHMWDILMSEFSPRFWQTSISATLIFSVSIAFSKLSVLAFYLRISPDRVIRRAVHFLIGLVCVYTLIYILLMIFRCRPISSGWDLTVEGKCVDSIVPMLTLSIANIVIDLFILVLPIRIVIPLQIPLRQKVSLALLFATGGFVCVASIKRTVIMSPLLRSDDYTWDVSSQMIWTYIEVNAGVICASVPALKPFCMRYIPFIISSKLRAASQDKASSKRQSHSADKKRRSRNIYSYEMPSRDEVSESTLQDDEARLWSMANNEKVNNGKTREIIQEMESFDTLADNVTLPPKPEPAVVGFGTKRTENVNGIQITKETYISYGPA